jgi:integrase
MSRTTKGYLERRGKVYFAVWSRKGKRYRRTTGETDLAAARGKLADLVAPFRASDDAALLDALRGRAEGRRADADRLADDLTPPLKVADAWQAFTASKRRPDSGASTMKQYASEWRRFASWLGKTTPPIEYLRDIGRERADAYATDLDAAQVSPSTFNQHIRLLRLVWKVLAEQARCLVNPWDGIRPHNLNALAARKLALTPGQLDALLAVTETDADLHDLIILLSWTGLRLVDGATLCWGAVDFRRNILTVSPQKTARRTGKQLHIPLFPAARAMLDARQTGHVVKFDAPVFPTLDDLYTRDRSSLSARITKAFERAGLNTAEEREGRSRRVVLYGAHSLRHTFVTAATAAGMPAAIIKRITGHATDQMLEHYMQDGPELAAEIAARLTAPPHRAALAPGRTPAGMSPAAAIRALGKRTNELSRTVKTAAAARAALAELAELAHTLAKGVK